jgi:hypothetical protein
MPPSVDEWLPDRHLARFVVDALDLSAMSQSYRGSGSASYHPAVLLSILVYGYATGVFSSRKPERASYDSVPFRFIATPRHHRHLPATVSQGDRGVVRQCDGARSGGYVGPDRNPTRRQRIFQRGQCCRLRGGGTSPADRYGTQGSPFDAAPPPENPTPVEAMAYRLRRRRQETLSPAQTDAGTGVRVPTLKTGPQADSLAAIVGARP